MAINAKAGGTKRELPPAGNHVARVYEIIHIGTIPGEYMGEPKKINTVRIGWELPTEMRVFKEENGEQPMSISQSYTLSMHEKAKLRKVVEGMVGTALDEEEAGMFDVTKLLGMDCMVQINHKTSKAGNQYAVVASVATVPKGLKVPKAINKTKVLDYSAWNQDLFDSLPDFLKDDIRSSDEYKEKFGGETVADDEEITPEDIPL